jgi:L-histidine N-alpha-methyltransferase
MRYRFDVRVDAEAFRKMLEADVRRGLAARPRSLPPKYFYDERGAELFDRITELPEYYLTRAEDALLPGVSRDVLGRITPDDIVELGPGSGRKVRIFLDRLVPGAIRYVPVDFGRDGLADAVTRLTRRYGRLRVHALVGDFERDLHHVPPASGRRLVLFLGSTIGNFDPPAREALLRRIRELLGPDDRLLLGVDLVKARAVLEAAYDDAAGVTREFNRNVLRVINHALAADFNPEAFRHRAVYDEAASRVEMHLVAIGDQRVRIAGLGMTLEFRDGDDIWTESSYKFTRASTETALAKAELALECWYTDAGERFGLALARPIAAR